MTGFVSETKPVNLLNYSQKCDIYISQEGMTELLFSSQYPKSKDFGKYCCNVLFLHIRHQLTDKLEENHQLAITGMQKEHQLEIQGRENQVQTLNMKKWHCKHSKMFIVPCCKDVRIRYMALLSFVMSLVQMIQAKIKSF